MAVHVRVVTPITSKGFRKASDFKGLMGPGDTLSHVEIDKGPASIECEYEEMLAIPDTVAKIIQAERDGAGVGARQPPRRRADTRAHGAEQETRARQPHTGASPHAEPLHSRCRDVRCTV